MTHHEMHGMHGKSGLGKTCPHCGCDGHGSMGKGKHANMGKIIVKKAWKKTLIDKVAVEIEKRHADKLNEMAKEMVDIADSKMKMKADIWKKKQAVKETFWSIFEEE